MQLKRVKIVMQEGDAPQTFITDRDVQDLEAEFMFLTNLVSTLIIPGAIEGVTEEGREALNTAQQWIAQRVQAKQDLVQGMGLSVRYMLPDKVAIVIDRLFMGTALTLTAAEAEGMGVTLIKTVAYLASIRDVQQHAQALREKEASTSKPS